MTKEQILRMIGVFIICAASLIATIVGGKIVNGSMTEIIAWAFLFFVFWIPGFWFCVFSDLTIKTWEKLG